MKSDTVVAPRAGAWIETGKGRIYQKDFEVAPRAGAWIENDMVCDSERQIQKFSWTDGKTGVF